ncbi:hypothetical protein PG985_005417 [Apiospora marii]|uniref:uncharacterized protein n=1 Tax=Apiospora marii TaxID=335849 RepID=UPI00312E2FAC
MALHFTDLPFEIVLEISKYLTLREMSFLCRCSKNLSCFWRERLYESDVRNNGSSAVFLAVLSSKHTPTTKGLEIALGTINHSIQAKADLEAKHPIYLPDPNPLSQSRAEVKHFLPPLFISIALGQTKISKRLIEAGAPLVLRNSFGTVLHHAAHHGSTIMVEHILKEKLLDVNSKDHFGYTAVFSAVMGPRPAKNMIHLLFEYGADINQTITHVNRDLESPLSIACDQGKWLIAELLLSLGAPSRKPDCPDVRRGQNGLNPYSRTALTAAVLPATSPPADARTRHARRRVILELLRSGEDPNQRYYNRGHMPRTSSLLFALACQRRFWEAELLLESDVLEIDTPQEILGLAQEACNTFNMKAIAGVLSENRSLARCFQVLYTHCVSACSEQKDEIADDFVQRSPAFIVELATKKNRYYMHLENQHLEDWIWGRNGCGWF